MKLNQIWPSTGFEIIFMEPNPNKFVGNVGRLINDCLISLEALKVTENRKKTKSSVTNAYLSLTNDVKCLWGEQNRTDQIGLCVKFKPPAGGVKISNPNSLYRVS